MASSIEALFNLGLAALQAGKLDDAERHFKKFLKRQPNNFGALNLLGIVLTQRERYAEAERYIKSALTVNARNDATFYNYGIILKALGRPAEALERFSQALTLNAGVAETWNNRGTAFNDLRLYRQAIADFDKAISVNPNYPDALCNKGKSLAELKQYDDAFAAYDRALTLKPDLAEAWFGRGSVFTELKQYDDAFAAYDRALTLKPDLKYLEGARLHAKLMMCDWNGLDTEVAHLLSAIRQQKLASAPFAVIAIPSSSEDQLQCARRNIADQPSFARIWRGEKYSHDRIRVAYLSADLYDHATAYLIAGLFERHDKSRFEMTAISFGPDQHSDLRHRIKNSVEHFIDVRLRSDQEVAELIRDREFDIAVDLNGFTRNARTDILARRPAPIQVNYLGYPGTMGADCFDYIVADRTVIPEDQFELYSEKVIWLPDCYQANDDRRPIPEHTPSRCECGLPETAFVFCCFNNAFKIAPEMFGVWMRLLTATEGSVLWLMEGNSTVSANLRREAERRGVSSQRLIFAPRMALANHLARQRQADLFLDTLPYNAHTTASDALWAGLPVLTCLGSTFAGRVAGSLLKAVGLAELITTSLEDYEALALKLARDPSLLASLKEKLARNRDTYPLFNTARFARYLEKAYTMMWERQQNGKAPQSFAVEPTD